MILPIGDPGFESREVGEFFQTSEVPTQVQEAPTHILEGAELSHSNQQQSFPPEKLGGKLNHFSLNMGVNYRRPLDFKCNKARARARVYDGTFPSRFPSSNKYELYPKVSDKQGNKTLTCNRLHQRSKKNRKTFSLQQFHGPQEKWGSQTSDQFEGLESISSLPSFQDGKFSNSKGLDTGMGTG